MSDSLQPYGLQHTRLLCLHHLPGIAQTHVHWVGDAIQPSHPLMSPSPAFNLSQHQGLFQWVSCSHQVAKLLELWSLLIWKTNKPHWSIFTFISFYYPNSPRPCLLVRSYWNPPMSHPSQMGRRKCLWRIQIEPLKQLLSTSNLSGPTVRASPCPQADSALGNEMVTTVQCDECSFWAQRGLSALG